MLGLHHKGEARDQEGHYHSTCSDNMTAPFSNASFASSASLTKNFLSRGFTLIELMVVVAIIALLAATAIPQYRKYQAKSRTTEAKLALASIYTAAESYNAEYNHYSTCLAFMGYEPSGSPSDRYYTVGFSSASTAHTTSPSACTSAPGSTLYYSGTKVPAGGATALTNTALLTARVGANWSTFSAEALGIVDKNYTASGTADRWYIDSNKTLLQSVVGY
jgi:type IV pilus assembly protein PilA